MSAVIELNPNYQTILQGFAKIMTRLKRPRRMLKLITRFVDREMGLSHTSILVLDERRRHFIFADSKGHRRFPIGLLKFDIDHPLVSWFKQTKKAGLAEHDSLYRPDLIKWLSSDDLDEFKRFSYERLLETMTIFKAELIVPGYYKNSLLAVLVFGKKADGEEYTEDDVSFLHTLAHNSTMAIQTARYHQSLEDQNNELQRQVLEIERLRKKEKQTYYQILKALAQEVYVQDQYTFGHIHQVERLGIMTAQEMNMDLGGRKKDILSASLILHDVGKIGIPDAILKKPARLDPDEWEIMKTHVEKGVTILEPLDDFKEVANIIHHHHERFDGTGYPRGIKGEDIPMESRIITVVDAFHAIVSKRNYDPERPVDEAFRELEDNAGTQFCPTVVKAFICAMKKNMKKRGLQVH